MSFLFFFLTFNSVIGICYFIPVHNLFNVLYKGTQTVTDVFSLFYSKVVNKKTIFIVQLLGPLSLKDRCFVAGPGQLPGVLRGRRQSWTSVRYRGTLGLFPFALKRVLFFKHVVDLGHRGACSVLGGSLQCQPLAACSPAPGGQWGDPKAWLLGVRGAQRSSREHPSSALTLLK